MVTHNDTIIVRTRTNEIKFDFQDPAEPRWLTPVAIAIGLIITFIIWIAVASAQTIPAPTKALQVAQSEIGRGELFLDNHGPDVARYMRGIQGQPWCAGFVSYCLKKAGFNLPYITRAKDFARYGRQLGKREIKPGDIAIFTRGGGGHVGIIKELRPDRFTCIEGNSGRFPARVKIVTHRYSDRNIYCFIRLKGR